MQDKPSPLISANSLLEILDDPDVGIVDCRFSLDDPDRGQQAWTQAAIPGAAYGHLDRDLSDHTGEAGRGRHPLPSPVKVRQLRASWGFGEDTFIVCYDDAGGPFAARLWWMLRWIGHEAVAVLDGGWQAWLAIGGPSAQGVQNAGNQVGVEASGIVRTDLVADPEYMVASGVQAIDARARPRYLGVEEPIDPIAGHIPGAINMPWLENLAPDGRFLPAEQLAARWAEAGGSEEAVCYCGSGVTACHNILAVASAGLPLPRLYPPSWSGWISDPSRPVSKKEEG